MIENAHTLLVETPAPARSDKKRWSKELIAAVGTYDPADLQRTSVDLLAEIPFAAISHNLGRVATGYESSQPLKDLIFLRRLCMVARDGMLLTSSEAQRQPLVPLRDLCRTLGQVVDSRGTDQDALPYARDCADGLALEGMIPVVKPVSGKELRKRVASTVSVNITTKPEKPTSENDYHKYHDRRKALRAGTHVALLLALATDMRDSRALELALQGKGINEKYGRIKNKLHSRAQKLSSR